MSDEAKEYQKRKDMLRKKEERLRNKMFNKAGKKPIDRIPSALGKVRNRIMKALPKDPERALEVVDGIKKMMDKKMGARVA